LPRTNSANSLNSVTSATSDFESLGPLATSAAPGKPLAKKGAPPDAPSVSSPLFFGLNATRSALRNYILRQTEWHSYAFLPFLHKLRSRRSATLHALFSCGELLGSEMFYFLVIPFLSWSAPVRAALPMFVTFFAVNLYVGNFLKNLLALARPLNGAAASARPARETNDFGWPSMYAVNAVALPFFAMRYWYGGFGTGTPLSAANPVATALSYTLSFLWVVLICGARLYSGASSPADVQGGMLVGGVLVRLWLPISDMVNEWIVGSDSRLGPLPQWAVLLLISFALLACFPFTPNDSRSWAAFGYSVKGVAFANAFMLGSNFCAQRGGCAAELPASFSLALAAQLSLRMLLGFALLGAVWFVATVTARAVEHTLYARLYKTPCAPVLIQNTLRFAALGISTSVGVPLVFRALSI